jgi:hypothetical protein
MTIFKPSAPFSASFCLDMLLVSHQALLDAQVITVLPPVRLQPNQVVFPHVVAFDYSLVS